jgi:hypothetical protein
MKNHPLTLACLITLGSIFAAAACYDGENHGHDADAETDVTHELIDTPPDTVPDEDADPADVQADDAPGELTVEVFCGAVIQFLCDYFADCCTEEERARLTDSVHCDDIASAVAECAADYNPLVTGGLVVMDETAFAECRSQMNGLVDACPNMWVFLNDSEKAFDIHCQAVFVGQTPTGQPCSEDDECAPGTFCDYGGGESSCTPYRSATEACVDNIECGPTRACIGERCGDVSGEGGACDEASDCEGALGCDVTDRCAPLGAAGTPCMDDVECEGACDVSTEPGQCMDLCNGL